MSHSQPSSHLKGTKSLQLLGEGCSPISSRATGERQMWFHICVCFCEGVGDYLLSNQVKSNRSERRAKAEDVGPWLPQGLLGREQESLSQVPSKTKVYGCQGKR